MSTIQEQQLSRLRRYITSVKEKDPKLAEEIADSGVQHEMAVAMQSPEAIERQIELESIAMRTTRPVLAIRNNETKLIFIDEADSEIWGERIKKAKPLLDDAIRAVGRIDLKGGQLTWVGTGWLVAENILATNRHVAREFAVRKGDGFTFKMGISEQMSADVDFLQEIDNPDSLVFKLIRPLHIEDTAGPDVAFFEIEMIAGDSKLAKPIDLATNIAETENIATIGYPAYDSRIPEPDLMERIYGKTYNKKRLAPGGVTRVEQTRLWHNCTTLGGNSGSVVFDLVNGQAVGLHFSGSFLATNYAVRADVVKKILADVRAGRATRRTEAPTREFGQTSVKQSGPSIVRQDSGGSASLTIPLTVNVSFSLDRSGLAARSPYKVSPATSVRDVADFVDETEAVASDYRNRGGYEPAFLGKKFAVDLPTITRNADDILDFEIDGEAHTELRYEHFSVIMSRSRRMCILSAVNIDGNQSKKSARVSWKWDPRIPRDQQIMKECYGSPPKFSRGHMTRREDPGWGTPTVAKRGNEDSMHVTNVTPQMQAFNAPIWLALEDYALQHAREDEMKISVFTGPYFANRDPEMYGVRIPLAFWKIIVFIHDETGKLCATGYEMNQEQSLQPEEEFVFGPFTSPQLGTATQVSIRSIEARSGINSGKLAGLDPLAGDEESILGGGPRPPLLALEQIQFVR
ncbi:MAG: DNA/RNA non-specific endonuclease [Candidatus Binataceae bacterium]